MLARLLAWLVQEGWSLDLDKKMAAINIKCDGKRTVI